MSPALAGAFFTTSTTWKALLINKKKQTTDTLENLDKFPDNYVEEKKLIPKGYLLYNSIYTIFLKLRNYGTRGTQRLKKEYCELK